MISFIAYICLAFSGFVIFSFLERFVAILSQRKEIKITDTHPIADVCIVITLPLCFWAVKYLIQH
jgi:hypothetical protein